MKKKIKRVLDWHQEERNKCKTQEEREELLRKLLPPKVIKKLVVENGVAKIKIM